MDAYQDREAWLTEAVSLLLDCVVTPAFVRLGVEREFPKIRVSVGFGKHQRKAKAVAQCFAREASTDGFNEIFVSPEVNDNQTILVALTEAVIAAIDNCESGRRGLFSSLRSLVGISRKGDLSADFISEVSNISEALGPIPHAKLNLDKVHKKQSTRQLKICCHGCNFIARTSHSQALRWFQSDPRCPVCRGDLTFPNTILEL